MANGRDSFHTTSSVEGGLGPKQNRARQKRAKGERARTRAKEREREKELGLGSATTLVAARGILITGDKLWPRPWLVRYSFSGTYSNSSS